MVKKELEKGHIASTQHGCSGEAMAREISSLLFMAYHAGLPHKNYHIGEDKISGLHIRMLRGPQL